MMEPEIVRGTSVPERAQNIYISDSGKVVLATYPSGYTIFNENGALHRDAAGAKAKLISDRDIIVVGEGRNLSFYNSVGTLLWKSVYDAEIVSFEFIDGEGLILLDDGVVVSVSGLKNEMGRIDVREDARWLHIDPTGRFFAVVGDMGVDVHSSSTLARQWSQEFMEKVHDAVLYRGATRTAIALKTGDFYLLNRNGRRILEYKFQMPPKMSFDGYGNIVVSDVGKVKILNDRGTLLKSLDIAGRCMAMRASKKSEYLVCGTDRGNIYFFNKSDVLWDYSHKEGINAVAITPSGEYVAVANREVMVFDNLTYYLEVLRESQKKLGTVGPRDPHYSRLYDIVKKMKGAYLKRDFKMLMSMKKVFDGAYSQIERSRIIYAFVVDSLFFPSQTSKNMLYVKSEFAPEIKLYGEIRYKITPLPPKGNIRRYSVVLQPVHGGEIPVKVEIRAGGSAVKFLVKLNADGVPRKKRVLSNGNYRELIR